MTWTDAAERLPEPNTLVLTSDGPSWELAFWSRAARGWRCHEAFPSPSVAVTHWMALPPLGRYRWRSTKDVPPPFARSLVKADGAFYIAFRGDPRAPHSVWQRCATGRPDEPLHGVTSWSPLPRLPGDPQQGFHG